MSEVTISQRRDGVSITDMCLTIWVRNSEIDQLIKDLKKAKKELENNFGNR